MAELVCVGCGPGDPELLTVKAVNAINAADTIMCPASNEDRPSIALSVVSDIIDKTKNQEIVRLIFPMTKDKDVLEATWKKNAKIMAEKVLSGKNVVYLTIGDPYLYSTWIYMHREIKLNHPEIKITVVPGIVSIFSFASKIGVSVAEGAEKVLSGKNVVYITIGDPYLYSTWIYMHREIKANYPEMKISVVPGIVSIFSFASKIGVSVAEGAEKVSVIPSCYDLSTVKEIARNSESMIFLKDGRYFDQVIQVLKDAGFPDNSIFAIGQDLGTDHEIIRKMTLGEVNDDTLTTKYFSILVVKRV